MITQSRLKKLLAYDENTGEFRWRISRGPKRAGARAGSIAAHGYVIIGIDQKLHYAHRLAWLYVHGVLPKELDHINRNRSDNKFRNLREVTRSENNKNQCLRGCKSGVSGVWPNGRKWVAVVGAGKNRKSLGQFDTVSDAKAARQRAMESAS